MDINEVTKEELVAAIAQEVAKYLNDNFTIVRRDKSDLSKQRVDLGYAAKILGMSKQHVKEHMRNNLWKVPIGYAIKKGTNYEYLIYWTMLMKHIGYTEYETKYIEDMECQRVSVKDASAILGLKEQGLRVHMQQNVFEIPIGYMTSNGRIYNYQIYRPMLERLIGRR